jgi:hypothetical protein
MPTAAELTILIQAQDQASQRLQQVGQQVERLERQVQSAGRSGGSGLLGGLLGGAGLGAGLAVAQQAFGAIGGIVRGVADSIFTLNSGLEQSTIVFANMTGSASRARDLLQALRSEAARSPFGDAETIQAGQALLALSDNTQASLLNLVQLAERLATTKPEEGLVGAARALVESSGGNLQSLRERFEAIGPAAAQLAAQGVPPIEAISRALDQLGISAQTVDMLGHTFTGLTSTIQSFFDEFRRRLGEGLFQRVEDALQHIANLIDQFRPQLLDWASQVGAVFGALAERLVNTVMPALERVLNVFVPGLGSSLATELSRGVAPLQQATRNQQQEAATLTRAYQAQVAPLQEQLRILQENVQMQRVQDALATNRAGVQRLQLGREIEALQRAAGANTDPNAPGLTTRQQLIAYALQERQLTLQQLDLEGQQRPRAIQNLQTQIANVQKQLDDAKTQFDASIRRVGTGPAAPEAVQDARARGEELADGLLKAYQAWIEKGGGTVWGAILKSYEDWWNATGKTKAAQLGQALGDTLGAAAGAAAGAAISTGITDFLTGPHTPLSPATLGTAIVKAFGLPVGQPGLTNFGNGPSAQAGPSVHVETGAVQVNGQPAPNLDEALRKAITDLLHAFGVSVAGTDPGASPTLQGAR